MEGKLFKVLRLAASLAAKLLRLEVLGTAAILGCLAFSITISIIASRPGPAWPSRVPTGTNAEPTITNTFEIKKADSNNRARSGLPEEGRARREIFLNVGQGSSHRLAS